MTMKVNVKASMLFLTFLCQITSFMYPPSPPSWSLRLNWAPSAPAVTQPCLQRATQHQRRAHFSSSCSALRRARLPLTSTLSFTRVAAIERPLTKATDISLSIHTVNLSSSHCIVATLFENEQLNEFLLLSWYNCCCNRKAAFCANIKCWSCVLTSLCLSLSEPQVHKVSDFKILKGAL